MMNWIQRISTSFLVVRFCVSYFLFCQKYTFDFYVKSKLLQFPSSSTHIQTEIERERESCGSTKSSISCCWRLHNGQMFRTKYTCVKQIESFVTRSVLWCQFSFSKLMMRMWNLTPFFHKCLHACLHLSHFGWCVMHTLIVYFIL